MRLAKRLIAGVDLWLNTPIRLQEASGTSGQKACLNGVLNLSVMDGWWYEGYREGAGWALPAERVYENQTFQDELDAFAIYSLLENEIIPTYYENGNGYSPTWMQYIKKSIAEIAPYFNTKRMLDEYYDRFYHKLANRSNELRANNYAKAKEIVAWKENMASNWDKFEVVKLNFNPNQYLDIRDNKNIIYGEVVIDKKDMIGDLGVECVMVDFDPIRNKAVFIEKYEFDLIKTEGSLLYFQTKEPLNNPGTHQYALRVFPKNPDLPHRMDFAYVRWI